MTANELIDLLAARVAAYPLLKADAEVWEAIAVEYERVTGKPLNRADPYHVMLANETFSTIKGPQL